MYWWLLGTFLFPLFIKTKNYKITNKYIRIFSCKLDGGKVNESQFMKVCLPEISCSRAKVGVATTSYRIIYIVHIGQSVIGGIS